MLSGYLVILRGDKCHFFDDPVRFCLLLTLVHALDGPTRLHLLICVYENRRRVIIFYLLLLLLLFRCLFYVFHFLPRHSGHLQCVTSDILALALGGIETGRVDQTELGRGLGQVQERRREVVR